MDQQAFEQAKAAYQRGDWATAAAGLARCKSAGEISGAVDHLLGNSLMKLGRYRDAASAYASALNDRAYGKVGALSCNQGRALLAAGDAQAAVTALTTATRDPEYPTPYKAYLALGNAQLGCGNVREAGIAFRNAAIDDANPDPAVALERLGSCFMQLGRPVDAVEAYRTALDFAPPAASQITNGRMTAPAPHKNHSRKPGITAAACLSFRALMRTAIQKTTQMPAMLTRSMQTAPKQNPHRNNLRLVITRFSK